LSLYFGALAFALANGLNRWRNIGQAGRILWVIILLAFCVDAVRQTLMQELQITVDRNPLMREEIISKGLFWNSLLLENMLLIEMGGYGLLAMACLHQEDVWRKAVIWFVTASILVLANHRLQPQIPIRYSGNLLACLTTSCFAIWVLYRLAASKGSTLLPREPAFWIWSVLLIYHCCTLAFWGFQPLLSQPYPNPMNPHQVEANAIIKRTQLLVLNGHAALNVLLYLGLGLSFSVYRPMRSHEI
jgi:hypothetical protein